MFVQSESHPAQEGQIAFVKMPLTNMLNLAIQQYNSESDGKTKVPEDHEILLVTVPCRIKYIKSFYGKMAS